MCSQKCGYCLSDFTFVRNLSSSGAQGQTSIRRGKDDKLFCFKTITVIPSETLPEEKFMFNELQSPFLVDLLHCFLVDGQVYLCMEYCEGGSLFELLESDIALSDEDILFIFVQLAHGLNHLHGKSIIHRDIKPENIVLTSRTPPYRVKYCDFRLSKQVENTIARTFTGTFQFLAPEVVAIWYGEVPDNHHYTPAVDIWSLGVVLYLLKEKGYPFKNPNEILSGNIPTSNSLFGEIIKKMMVFEASRRISVEQLVNLPEIKQVYDFIESFDDSIFSKYQIWIMKKEIERQSNLSTRLESTVHHQNSKIQQLESILSLLSSDQSNLIDQFKELLPYIPRIKAFGGEKQPFKAEQRLIDIQSKDKENVRLSAEEFRLEKQKEFKSNPLAFICKYPSEVYRTLGNRTKFIGETKGSCLELANDDCLVTSAQECNENSFLTINHPLNGRITLTLMSTRSEGWFNCFIGYFHPIRCQEGCCYDHFIGINPDHSGT
ncbi:hypothetical protein RCL1_008013 [Eukaryota sp. TZLM3-RCL]